MSKVSYLLECQKTPNNQACIWYLFNFLKLAITMVSEDKLSWALFFFIKQTNESLRGWHMNHLSASPYTSYENERSGWRGKPMRDSGFTEVTRFWICKWSASFWKLHYKMETWTHQQKRTLRASPIIFSELLWSYTLLSSTENQYLSCLREVFSVFSQSVHLLQTNVFILWLRFLISKTFWSVNKEKYFCN